MTKPMRLLPTIVIFQIAVLSATAQWQLVDDFRHWDAGTHIEDSNLIGWVGTSEMGTPELWFLEDPFDPSNVGMYVYPKGTNEYSRTWVSKRVAGSGIMPGEKGTIFFRTIFKGKVSDWNIGTSDKRKEYNPDTGDLISPAAFSDFNALIRLNPEGIIEHRDGCGYVSTDPPITIEPYKWYSFWLEIDNSWDTTAYPATSTGTYTLYMQSSAEQEPILISVGTNPPKSLASFCRIPQDEHGNPKSIVWIMFSTASEWPPSGSGQDAFLIDDIYYKPQGMYDGDILYYRMYANWKYILSGPHDIDTEDFLGWINVQYSPFVFSYRLGGWLYMEEPAADAPGVWGYFYK